MLTQMVSRTGDGGLELNEGEEVRLRVEFVKVFFEDKEFPAIGAFVATNQYAPLFRFSLTLQASCMAEQ